MSNMMSTPWEKPTDNCESMPSDYACPIDGCPSHPNEKKIHWTHSNCGGSFRIYENGKEKCQKCGKEDYFCKWSYSCSKDSKSGKIGYTRICNILAKIIAMDTKLISSWGLMNIVGSIRYQYEKFPEFFEEEKE